MATRAALEDFGIEELCDFLSSSGKLSEDTIEKFRYNRISGSTFFELNEADLKELPPILGDRKAVQRMIASYQSSLTVSFKFSAISCNVYECLSYFLNSHVQPRLLRQSFLLVRG